MLDMSGRQVPVSLPRRWIADLMRVSRGRPIISFERRMHLAPLAAARAKNRVSWSILFVKAFAIVAQRHPELRRSRMALPWPYFYEADRSLASLPFEREFRGEPAVFFGLLREPETQPLRQLQEHLEYWRTAPIEDVREFRRMIRVSKLPGFLRYLAWLIALNVGGRFRANVFGTFGVSVTANGGATALNIISPLSSVLNYGLFNEHHALDVRLHFDHRVYDGMTAARVLVDLEETLNGAMVEELSRGLFASGHRGRGRSNR